MLGKLVPIFVIIFTIQHLAVLLSAQDVEFGLSVVVCVLVYPFVYFCGFYAVRVVERAGRG